MKKLVLVIALLGSGVNLLAYGENPVKNEVVVENNLAAADDPNDLVFAYEVESPNGSPLYFSTLECAQAYEDQFPLADLIGWTRVDEGQVFVCMENSSVEEASYMKP